MMGKLILTFLLFCGSSLFAAPALVQAKTCTTGGTAPTTLGCTFTSNVTAGNLVAATFTIYNFNETITGSCSDNVSGSYSSVTAANQGSAPHVYTRGCYAPNSSGGSTTITVTVTTGTYIVMGIYEISGVDTSTPLDQSCQQSSTSSSTSPLSNCSITTTVANNFILASFGSATSETWSNGSGGTYVLSQHTDNAGTTVMTFGDTYRIVSSTGTYTPDISFTVTMTTGYAGIVMSFKQTTSSTYVANPSIFIPGI